MKIAIVHDFLMQQGGAEKVVEVLHGMFPNAPIYTSAFDARAMPASYQAWDIRTSFLQRMLFKQRSHRLALMLYPMAFESFDLSEYDLVISSSSAFAKGVITQPHTVHISYTYTPMRYAWSTGHYMENEKASKSLRGLLVPGMHYLRMWDQMASNRVDHHIAISTVVAQRIRKFYHRDCDIIYPPVDVSRFEIAPSVEDYYLIVSRFVPYKRLDLAVAAFTKLGRPLKVVGSGRQLKHLKSIAGPNVEFLGAVDDDALVTLMAGAKAFIMPGEEDFGLAPVEANACGRPVIAYAAGGALDTQVDGVTGVLFRTQSIDGLAQAVLRSESIVFDPHHIRDHAQKFDAGVFRRKFMAVIANVCKDRGTAPGVPEEELVRVEDAPFVGASSWSRTLPPGSMSDRSRTSGAAVAPPIRAPEGHLQV